MSWDVLMIRTKTNCETINAITSENILPFTQAEIAAEIQKIATELHAICNCTDLSWQTLDGNGWSIEFNVGEEAETPSVMLHIRGGEPKAVFALLMTDLNTRLIDGGTGFITFDKPTSFETWKAYRDRMIDEQSL